VFRPPELSQEGCGREMNSLENREESGGEDWGLIKRTRSGSELVIFDESPERI